MRARSILTGIKIPPQFIGLHSATGNLTHQLIVTLFTDRAADDLADLREEHICALHSWSRGHTTFVTYRSFTLLLVLLHIECFDTCRVVGHDNRFLEMLLNQVALMFRSKVITPIAWELKLLAILDSLLKNLDTLCIGQTNKLFLEHSFQTRNQIMLRSDELIVVDKLQVVLTLLQGPSYTVLDEILFQIHQFLLIQESHLRFHHPELSQMSGCIRVFSSERRTESIDGA